MPLSPQWWANGPSSPFRDNADGAITAATLRTFSEHLDAVGVRTDWAEYAPAEVDLTTVPALPVTDGSATLPLKVPGDFSSRSATLLPSPGGGLSLPDMGFVLVEVQVYGEAVFTNLGTDDLVHPLLTVGTTEYVLGSTATTVAGVANFATSRRVLVDTSGGVDVSVGITTVVAGTWGDGAEGDTVDISGVTVLLTATPAAPLAV